MSFYRVQYGYLCLKLTWKIESVTHNWRNCLQIMPKNWFGSQIPGRTYNIVRGKSAFNVGGAYAYNIKYEMLLFKHKQLVTSVEKVFSPWILHRMISRTICYGIILFKCGQYPIWLTTGTVPQMFFCSKRGGWGNGVKGDDFTSGIGDMGARLIAVNRNHLSRHDLFSFVITISCASNVVKTEKIV